MFCPFAILNNETLERVSDSVVLLLFSTKVLLGECEFRTCSVFSHTNVLLALVTLYLRRILDEHSEITTIYRE
uniref:Uncharacterized protein n=1 Tax=Pararge aegeria TaxID=116150 RepID=S4PRE7_9NEOP